MKRANISYTKNHLSELLNLVREGESVLIVDRNTPVARLDPVTYGADEQAWLADRIRRDLVTPPKKGGRKVALAHWKPVTAKAGADIVRAVDSDREEGL